MGAIMVRGAGPDAGASALVAGLCRALTRRGLSVRPFRPRGISRNVAITVDGGIIARAQAIQALACGVEPHTDMNPARLRPGSETAHATLPDEILQSYRRLRSQCDIVVVEGSASDADFAHAAHVPTVLVGDSFTSAIVDTSTCLESRDAAMIHGFILNKFCGDPARFAHDFRRIAALSGWPGLGVIPWLPSPSRLPSENIPTEQPPAPSDEKPLIVCPITPGISNFDDLDPLRLESAVELRMIPPGQPIPAEARLVLLAGSMTTIADLHAMRAQGWDADIRAHWQRGGEVLGLCGGYQMLGKTVSDPQGMEGPPGAVAEGLGLLDVETVMTGPKVQIHVTGVALGARLAGYEMHKGKTHGPGTDRPLVRFDDGRLDGAISADGRVAGCYVHGLLGLAEQRAAWLGRIGATATGIDHHLSVDGALDDIAAALERHLAIDTLLELAEDSV